MKNMHEVVAGMDARTITVAKLHQMYMIYYLHSVCMKLAISKQGHKLDCVCPTTVN